MTNERGMPMWFTGAPKHPRCVWDRRTRSLAGPAEDRLAQLYAIDAQRGGGRLRVAKPAPSRENRRPIDIFMFSLAQD